MNEELVIDRLDRQERRINNHSERLDRIEICQAEANVKIENLCKSIVGQTKALWWLIGLMATALVGFFIAAIQNSIF